MKILRSSIAALGFSGILCLALAAQEAGVPLVTPSTVSVVTVKCKEVRPGDKCIFQLHFDPAPDGYRGGSVGAVFEKVGGASSSVRIGPEPEALQAGANANLQDREAFYKLELTIDPLMSPGKWKLVKVFIGRSSRTTFNISEDVSFDVLDLLPVVVHVQAPKSVEAGQQYAFTVALEEYPKDLYKGCVLDLGVGLREASTSGRYYDLNPNPMVAPDHLSFKFSHDFEPDIPSGPWQIEVTDGAHNPADHYVGCRYPQLKGDVRFSFNVEPDKDLVKPTSVEVTVNPSQIQLLRGEIDRLQAKVWQIRGQVKSKDMAANETVLRSSVQEAMADLDVTEKNYKEEEKDPSYAPAIGVFFGDIRLKYNEALKALINNSAQAPQTGPRLKNVTAVLDRLYRLPDTASDLVLGSIEHNISAYELAVSTKALSFDLDVNSSPMGAQIFYKRDDEDDFHRWDRDTNSTVYNLVRAWYTIRIKLDGYISEDRPLDANKDPKPRIDITLNPKPKPKRGVR